MFQHNIDNKGRLSVPGQFREAIKTLPDDKLILTSNLDRCLVLYPSQEWHYFKEKAKTLPSMNKKVTKFYRFLFSRATPCSLDKQGRILIPQLLRDHAALEGETCLVGIDNKIEIWNQARWMEEDSLTTSNPEEILEAMADLGM
ncbi:MAG: division/cell wall cluster transcriptional repressor MraZ [Nitrospiria bacterium]